MIYAEADTKRSRSRCLQYLVWIAISKYPTSLWDLMHSRFITLSSQLSCCFLLRNGFWKAQITNTTWNERGRPVSHPYISLWHRPRQDVDSSEFLYKPQMEWGQRVGVFMNSSLHGKDTLAEELPVDGRCSHRGLEGWSPTYAHPVSGLEGNSEILSSGTSPVKESWRSSETWRIEIQKRTMAGF